MRIANVQYTPQFYGKVLKNPDIDSEIEKAPTHLQPSICGATDSFVRSIEDTTADNRTFYLGLRVINSPDDTTNINYQLKEIAGDVPIDESNRTFTKLTPELREVARNVYPKIADGGKCVKIDKTELACVIAMQHMIPKLREDVINGLNEAIDYCNNKHFNCGIKLRNVADPYSANSENPRLNLTMCVTYHKKINNAETSSGEIGILSNGINDNEITDRTLLQVSVVNRMINRIEYIYKSAEAGW